MNFENVQSRFAKSTKRALVLFRKLRVVESPELNEAFQIQAFQRSRLANTVLGATSLRDGGALFIDRAAGKSSLGSATIWAGDYLHEVEAAELSISTTGKFEIGISVTENFVTDVEEPELKGIVEGTLSFGKPLGARLDYDAVWALSGDLFFPIYVIEDGVVLNPIEPPLSDGSEKAVQRHIVESHGSHIASGFNVSYAGFDADTDEITLTIGSGVARARGVRVSRDVDSEFRYVEQPVLRQINSEQHIYPASADPVTIELREGH